MSNLRDELKEIYESKGSLTPQLVVQAARPIKSSLHSHFEWDDEVAGERHREHQARTLIRSVKLKYFTGDREERVRYFVSIKGEEGCVYKPTDEVVEDDVLTEIVLRDMERDWRQLQSRYGHFKEFAEMVRSEVEAA